MVLCFMVQQEKSPRFSLSDVHGKAQLMKELEEFCTQKFRCMDMINHTVCRVCRMYLCQEEAIFSTQKFRRSAKLGIF